ncbi:NAD-dependent epimerase/dehydratase family protein [Skermanella sp. TT6]|uniref:NAD-dependent epimerase/dehydratase family protein n=1 Tax=Skermanella cutis TaxID=2775420 RepID=A0ABX7BI53_9PROT|nr:NAD-dependent epimerase/dehydratase family protein [Skermanella sp. TT6]QQP92177.1 NAD-dependent epimerase/dehydratase family protein [Skermanella sp. TT6]
MTASLVTGGCGFLGRHLVAALLARGERVRVLDTAGSASLPPGVDAVIGSVTDASAVAQALDGMDRLYHLAGIPHLWLRDKSGFDQVNRVGTEIVLEQTARRNLDRIVHCSTEAVLIPWPAKGPRMVDENTRTGLDDMAGPYCRSKFLAERAALEAARGGLPVVVVNPTALVGPGDPNGTPPTRMLRMLAAGAMPLHLPCRLNLVDARDAALGHILAAEHGRIGERYILGGETVAMADLIDRVASLTGYSGRSRAIPGRLALAAAHASEWLADHVTHRPPQAPLTGVRLALAGVELDTSKARRDLGFTPRPLAETLADTLRDPA